MWNFSDLAKQAQELTEKASVSTGLFNLDAMQGGSEPERPAAKAPAPAAPLVSPSIFSLNALQSDGAVLFGSPAPAPVSTHASLSSSIFGTPDPKSPASMSSSALFGSPPEPYDHMSQKKLVLTSTKTVASAKPNEPIPTRTRIPPVQSPPPTPSLKVPIPAVVDSKPSSNDWDNDWDFDEQIVAVDNDDDDDNNTDKPHEEHNHNDDNNNNIGVVDDESNTKRQEGMAQEPNVTSATSTPPVTLMVQPQVVCEELVANDTNAIQPEKSVDLQPELKVDEDLPKESVVSEDLPQEWKQDDLDDMYDDEDDDNDDDDSNETEEQDLSKPAVEESNTIDSSFTGPPEPKTYATEDATLELGEPVEHEPNDAPNDVPNDALFMHEEIVMDSNATTINGRTVQTELIQSQSDVLIESEETSEPNREDHVLLTTIHDSPNQDSVQEIAESTDSLEDEIAGVLDDHSNPEVEPPADVDDDVYKPVDVEADGNDDPFGFAQPAENNAATNAETIQSVDPLPTFGLDNTPPAESSIVPPLPLIVDTQVQESEQQPQSVSSSIVEEEPSATIETSPIAPVIEHRQETEPSEKMISASVLDRFTDQMHRLEENHHNEILDLQRQHEQQLEDLRNSITHDQCEAQRTELERNFLNRLKEKDEQLQEIMRINEGMELKLDVLKREVTGTKKLLEERESAIGSSSVAHDRAKQLLEEKLRKLEENAGTTQADVVQLQAQLKQAQEELEESNEAYAALKSRVKTVATELKERRGECRTLAVANVELTEVNEQLTTKLAGLQAQLDDRDRSEVEKGEERDSLRDKIKALEEELQEAEKSIKERDAVGEKALAAYKKKAQNSLAVANARAASAMQAKEEAELEARAARSTADLALERARKAELKGDESLAEAKSYVKDMESQVAEIERKAKEAIDSFSELQAQLQEAIAEREAARTAREKMVKEVATLNRDLQQERNKTSELQQECADLQQRSNDLYEEVETLREELRKTATAAFMAHSNDASGTESNGGIDRHAKPKNGAEKQESESTILMLQRELQDANQAIKELKETLRTTLENQDENGNVGGSVRRGPVDNASTNPSGANDSTPLFYAMEKQAELNQAREEINRLANLLGELQSEKMQAYEAVESMKRERAAAEARLARYEKLGTAGTSKRHTSARIAKSSAYGGYGSHPVVRKQPDSDAMSIGSVDSADDLDGPTAETSQVNLEYLKNVMLSYLNAKTLNERKRLVPAVSAVLCLTAEETAAAMKSVQESGSVESVGVSFFEGLKLM